MDDKERTFIIKAISENTPTVEIAAALGRKPSTFWSYIRRNGISIKEVRTQAGLVDPWAEKMPEIVDMVRNMYSTDQIAMRFGVTPAQLRGLVGRYGVSINIERHKGRRMQAEAAKELADKN